MQKFKALIVGASELGTACALRLVRAGIQIVLLEKDSPLDIYHSRSFSGAVFSGSKSIENLNVKTFSKALDDDVLDTNSTILDFIQFSLQNREVPIVMETDAPHLRQLPIDFTVVCSSNLYANVKEKISENSKVIGFDEVLNSAKYAYTICNAGSHFGRVIYPFYEMAGSIEKKPIHKKDIYERVKAPLEGVFQSSKSINDLIHEKEEIGKINDIPILSPALGRISGILNSGAIVPAGSVFVEIDISLSGQSAHVLSKDSFCLAGAVLEAILYNIQLNQGC